MPLECRPYQHDRTEVPALDGSSTNAVCTRRQRGYPVDDFDQRADDISVDHPTVVENYRAAHDIHLSSQRGDVGTERQRQAFVHYRALFDKLLEPQTHTDPSRDTETSQEARA